MPLGVCACGVYFLPFLSFPFRTSTTHLNTNISIEARCYQTKAVLLLQTANDASSSSNINTTCR